ncbi:fibulin-1-like [Scyliorhinus canicula]|uniref:fibulin-1-like n=1 Tax=Scyliorhinus canicula TaxID=7830 RepID=UPI0018F55622|nr:fibulin-1-like [Scyliorhinus canicula]
MAAPGLLTIWGGILLCLAVLPAAVLCQQDCTGVYCPELENCIEETLEIGACCATCLQRGCACQGYMYYDCLRAGYRSGKIPALVSYYVDGGSTECKCPEGGGKILCSFIPCPELPGNCIKTYQPPDGCPQCARLGCVSSGQRYPAGHSFHVEPCTVCRCLSSGSLMCTPDADCGQGGGHPLGGPSQGVLADQKDPRPPPAEMEEGAPPTDEKRAAVSAESLAMCCSTGRRWAAEDGKCLRDSSHEAEQELCSSVREQCCLSVLEEFRCQTGVDAANRDSSCTPEDGDTCGSDVFKRCCECCSLGNRARRQGLACEQIPALGPGCGQVFTVCCAEADRHHQPPGNRREPRRPQGTASTGGQEWEDGRGNPSQVPWPAEEEKEVDHCPADNPCSQLCRREGPSMVCSCFPGYQLVDNGGFCGDVDECQDSVDRCGSSLICENTAGSFVCQPREQCGPGLTLDTYSSCVDTNECVALSQPCGKGFNCINTIGSYTCHRNIISCGHGYEAAEDNARCVDIDECQTGTHRCDGGQICRNAPGSYRCDCRQGYLVDPYTKACVDIDECRRYMGRLCAQKCENSPGSYHCSCAIGYRLAEDGRNCKDVNECEAGPCSQECANVYGSYQCYCRQGYTLNQVDRTTCEDVDECSLTASTLCAHHCVNTPGSFACICPDGYVLALNGRNCQDLDECTLGTHNCTRAETCFNVQGGFRCISFECPSNYQRVGQARCERLSCQDYVECQTEPQRITYYQLSFPINIRVPANIFRIIPSPVYLGDNILLGITGGNEDRFFSTRRHNNYTGFVYLQLQPRAPRDFLLDVEMTLIRQGRATKFIARIYVFITGHSL